MAERTWGFAEAQPGQGEFSSDVLVRNRDHSEPVPGRFYTAGWLP